MPGDVTSLITLPLVSRAMRHPGRGSAPIPDFYATQDTLYASKVSQRMVQASETLEAQSHIKLSPTLGTWHTVHDFTQVLCQAEQAEDTIVWNRQGADDENVAASGEGHGHSHHAPSIIGFACTCDVHLGPDGCRAVSRSIWQALVDVVALACKENSEFQTLHYVLLGTRCDCNLSCTTKSYD